MPRDKDESDTPQCGRCGDVFTLKLCEVHPDTDDRDRVEAHLCYDCRQAVPHRVLGGVQG